MLTGPISASKFIACNQLFQQKGRLLRCKIVIPVKNCGKIYEAAAAARAPTLCFTAFYVNATLENEGANVGQGGR